MFRGDFIQTLIYFCLLMMIFGMGFNVFDSILNKDEPSTIIVESEVDGITTTMNNLEELEKDLVVCQKELEERPILHSNESCKEEPSFSLHFFVITTVMLIIFIGYFVIKKKL